MTLLEVRVRLECASRIREAASGLLVREELARDKRRISCVCGGYWDPWEIAKGSHRQGCFHEQLLGIAADLENGIGDKP